MARTRTRIKKETGNAARSEKGLKSLPSTTVKHDYNSRCQSVRGLSPRGSHERKDRHNIGKVAFCFFVTRGQGYPGCSEDAESLAVHHLTGRGASAPRGRCRAVPSLNRPCVPTCLGSSQSESRVDRATAGEGGGELTGDVRGLNYRGASQKLYSLQNLCRTPKGRKETFPWCRQLVLVS